MAKILLIEDMEGVRSSLTTVLETAGHSVLEASDGEAGLHAADRQRVDLIITDIIMPKVDGSEVILSLKDRGQETPVLAISGGGNGASSESALLLARETADAVLPKPFSRDELLNTVNQLLGSGLA